MKVQCNKCRNTFIVVASCPEEDQQNVSSFSDEVKCPNCNSTSQLALLTIVRPLIEEPDVDSELCGVDPYYGLQ